VFPDASPRHDPPRLAVVVAHPDDETFGCGSLLLAAAADGWQTSVVCATRGEMGEAAVELEVARPLGEVREEELRDAALMLGVTDVVLLGFSDSGMEGDWPLRAVVEDDAAVIEAVRRVLTDLEPDVVVTLDGSDGHRDHIAIRDAAVAVARDSGAPVFLQCLARSLMDEWAVHMSRARPDLAYLRESELGTPDDRITLTIDTTVHYDARLRAMAAHASQTSPFDDLPDALKRAFLTREYLVQVS
jgi:LmbE family N-acetylglucosaminyl deacetylase